MSFNNPCSTLPLPLPLLTAALLLLLLPTVSPSGSFSTLAISHVKNETLVCALVLPPADGVDAGSGAAYKLHCTALPDGRRVAYPSTDIPYNAVAAGSGFLCGLMSPAGGHAAMRWWSFSDEAAANRSHPVGKRLYWGPSLLGLSAGGSHVCGISDFHDPTCWDWPALQLPPGLNFTKIALGSDFLCGIVLNGTLYCFGHDAGVTANVPAGKFKNIAAGWYHACAVEKDGGFVCWGDGRPEIAEGELPKDMSSMALGHNLTCIMSGNGTVQCWGPAAGGTVSVPEEYKTTQFVAIEAQGDTVCGVVLGTYAAVCWGNTRFEGRHLVYNQTMPGACAPKRSCQCDILQGSGILCAGGGNGDDYAVCSQCRTPLHASKISVGNGNNTTVAPGGKSKAVVVALGVTGVGLGVLAAVGLAFYLLLFKKWDRKMHVVLRVGSSSSRRFCHDVETSGAPPQPAPQGTRGLGCEEFPLKELVRVTNGFSQEKRVGGGSFGSVYRARLADGREVAIKRAERAASRVRRRRRFDAERAFRAELKLLSRVNHRNLVQLLGFCEERGERILVFEFLPHGTLHDHLHGQYNGASSPLSESWVARLRVALDAARGVEYLHCYAVPPVIHRDIKPSNILLDAEWTAKVSDFGLSQATTSGSTAVTAYSTSAAGTVGYMDPEYYRLQEFTVRSDVYSFGVVLLELLTGRKAIHRRSEDGSGTPRNVVEYAVPAVEAGETSKVLDDRVPAPRGHEAEAVAHVARIAAECVRARGRTRPVMSEVVAELEWAVGLCEEAIDRSGRDQHGSDLSRSRSESDDPSPFHTRELAVGSARLARAASYSRM